MPIDAIFFCLVACPDSIGDWSAGVPPAFRLFFRIARPLSKSVKAAFQIAILAPLR